MADAAVAANLGAWCLVARLRHPTSASGAPEANGGGATAARWPALLSLPPFTTSSVSSVLICVTHLQWRLRATSPASRLHTWPVRRLHPLRVLRGLVAQLHCEWPTR